MSAVIYVRVSSQEQTENYSLGNQERDCRAFSERADLDIDRVFREEGASAKTAERPQLQSLLHYCAANATRLGISAVVVYKLDRMARQADDYSVIRIALSKFGISVLSATENLDSSPMGKFSENMLAAIAQLDNDVRSERTIKGMQSALRDGRWMFRAPIGYEKPKDETTSPSLLIDPEPASLVRLAFERIATGQKSQREALDEVTILGLTTKHGKALTLQAFGSLLRNPIYKGLIQVPKWGFEGPGDFCAIVGAELFDSVQKVLSGRSPGKSGRRYDNPDFPLRRFVKCGSCEGSLTASWSRGRSGRYAYYSCYRRGCQQVRVPKEQLEGLFAALFQSLSVRPEVFDLLAAIVRDIWTIHARASRKAAERLGRRQKDLERRLDRLVDAFVQDRLIDTLTYERKRAALNRQMDETQAELQAHAVPDDVDLETTLDFAKAMLMDPLDCWNRLKFHQRAGFLRGFFPQGVTYADAAIGTGQMPWWFGHFEAESTEMADWAPPTGFEPVLPP